MTENHKCFLVPQGNRVVVEYDAFHYSGRLAIPEKYRRRPTSGHVIAVPADHSLDDWLGKRVLFAMFSGTDYKFKEGAPWVCLQLEEIQCVITLENVQLDEQFAPSERM